MRRNLVLVIIGAGDTSQHEIWTGGAAERNWDLIVGYSGAEPDLSQSPDQVLVEVDGPKWRALRQVFHTMADTIDQYDYVWCPDDHLLTDAASINAMFDICTEYGLSLAQPALSEDSYVGHEITRVDSGQVLRYTNYVETLAPCFGREFASRAMAEFAATTTGRGLESLWPTLLGEDDIAIIDAVTVLNVRRLRAGGSVRSRGNREGHPDTEYENFLADRGIDPVEPQVRRSVSADSVPGFAGPPSTRESGRRGWWMAPAVRKRLDPSRCVVLVPVADSIEPDCDRALFELERQGYRVWREFDSSGIDQVRSRMATDALDAGFEDLMWIDPDMSFPLDAVEQLRLYDLPIVCGVYAKPGQRELEVNPEPGTEQLIFGNGGGPVNVRYAAMGFMLTRRQVYENIREQQQLPECDSRFGRPVVPYFLPMTVPVGERHWYLGEDFAFCERARRSGFDVMADTRIRLGHIGRRAYVWEDAGSAHERYATYTFNLS